MIGGKHLSRVALLLTRSKKHAMKQKRKQTELQKARYTLIHCWQFLHDKVCHSDNKMLQRRWRPALTRLEKRLFGSHRASVRFANKHTAHRWL